MKRIINLIAFIIFIVSSLSAEVRLPAIIGSHMVLQQDSEVKLWGWCSASEKITIEVSWDKDKKYEATGTNGAQWMTTINTPNAGGPYTIKIAGSNTIVLEDVLIGEVWVCSGQSNMEWSADQGLEQSIKEAPYAVNDQIRFFYIPKTTSDHPQDDVHARWVVCHPMAMMHFSAIGYFFGKKLNATLRTPVGLINSNWGGTPAEAWTPAEVVNADPELKGAAAELKTFQWWPSLPGKAYNAMIYPLTHYKIAGVIWYQGESNVNTYKSYERLFTKMIDSWRTAWSASFPFYFVQIAPFDYGDDHIRGALLREAQSKSALHPNTGMVVVSDLVDDVKDIHPKEKKLVAERLANFALSQTYDIQGLYYKSPVYASHTVQGNKVTVKFHNVANGLKTQNGLPPSEFYISGADKVFLAANAEIRGNDVLLSHKDIKSPVAIRYGFTNTSIGNLISSEGLPVNLFRTDDWDDIQ